MNSSSVSASVVSAAFCPRAANLPNPGAYARTWRRVLDAAKTQPGAVQSTGKFYGKSVAQIADEYAKALQDRINARDPKTCAPRGKKDSQDYFWSAMRDARKLQEKNTKRIRFYQLETQVARQRFAERIDRYDD
jgi:hypothetical protein